MTCGRGEEFLPALITQGTDFTPMRGGGLLGAVDLAVPLPLEAGGEGEQPGRCSAASAQIAAESIPPDRKAPSGASLRRWTATESRRTSRIAGAESTAGAPAGRRSARQKR